jgi:hypothetical protein
MATIEKLKFLIGFYLAVLIFLLLCVTATPLLIRHGISLTAKFIIEEETLETLLIAALFAVSYLIFRGFNRSLKAYGRLADRASEDKSNLISRLAEAFNYIGTVNAEIKEIQSTLCGVDCYPVTKREFKKLLDRLAAKIMAVAGTPWIVIRMISRCSGRTVNEHASERQKGFLPSASMGNRAILEGRRVPGLQTIASRQKNLDLLTVCIFPKVPLSEEEIILITAITNQIEMLFMLHHAGCLHQKPFNDHIEKEIIHDTHY